MPGCGRVPGGIPKLGGAVGVAGGLCVGSLPVSSAVTRSTPFPVAAAYKSTPPIRIITNPFTYPGTPVPVEVPGLP